MPKYKISFSYEIARVSGDGNSKKIGKFATEDEAVQFIASTMEEYCAKSSEAVLKKFQFFIHESGHWDLPNTIGIIIIEEFSYESHAISRVQELRKIINKVYKSLKWRRKLRGARMEFHDHKIKKEDKKD